MSDDVVQQAKQVLTNLSNVLEAAGSSLNNGMGTLSHIYSHVCVCVCRSLTNAVICTCVHVYVRVFNKINAIPYL